MVAQDGDEIAQIKDEERLWIGDCKPSFSSRRTS